MEHLSARQHVVDMCRTMLERGYLKATEGNVSVRVPGRRLYAVTPSNYSYDRMRVEDVCIVDFDGKHVPDADRAGASLAPSIECGMHANIYRARPDVHAIVHTHQPYASALAVLRRPIPALTDEQVRFLGREVAIIDYAPSGTGILAKNVQKKITSGDNAFILANHGIVAVGTDPERAVFNMALLEKVSIAYLLALTTESGKVYSIPAPIREIAFAKLRSDEKRIAAQITKSVPSEPLPDAVPLPSADAAAREVVASREAAVVAEPDGGERAARARSRRGSGTRSARTPTSRTRCGGCGRWSTSRCAACGTTPSTTCSSGSRPSAGRARSSPTGRGPASRAACSTTSPSTTPSPSRSTVPTVPTSPTATGTSTSTSSRPAGRPCSAATTPR